jgi:hypothetical protein
MQKSYFEALSKKDNRFSIWIHKRWRRQLSRCTIVSEIAGTASILIAAELMITMNLEKDCYLEHNRSSPQMLLF